MEEKYSKLKLHFIYCFGICVAIIGFLLAIMFYPSIKAGEMLAFAGTITSIILAVLAIMVTLLDSSNQKNSINEIKESVSSLQEVSGELKILLDQHNSDITNKIVEIGNYDSRVSELTLTMKELLNKETFVKETGDSDNANKLKELVNEMNSTIQSSKEKRRQLVYENIPGKIATKKTSNTRYVISVKKGDQKNLDNFVKILLDMLFVEGVEISSNSDNTEATLTVTSPFNMTLDTIVNLAKNKGVEIVNIQKNTTPTYFVS